MIIRHPENPILVPENITPSREDFFVECLLNPAAFEFQGRIGLLLRVAERLPQEKQWISTPVYNPEGEIEIRRFRSDDPEVDASDPRLIRHRGVTYLTTLSHLRLAWSEDGTRFVADPAPILTGLGEAESYGVEDARITRIGRNFHITYTSVSDKGHGVSMISTQDWRNCQRHGMILPPPNKDCTLFEEPINGRFWMLHRPTTSDFAGNCIWSATSPDLIHWSDHRFVAAPRPGMWDEGRVGAGAAPIKTGKRWLAFYHGALPAITVTVLDFCCWISKIPRGFWPRARCRSWSRSHLMKPRDSWGGVVFTNGHVVRGDEVIIYYGAADRDCLRRALLPQRVAKLSVKRSSGLPRLKILQCAPASQGEKRRKKSS